MKYNKGGFSGNALGLSQDIAYQMHGGNARQRRYNPVQLSRREPTEEECREFIDRMAKASSFVKLVDGTGNNAAWAACLDAYEYIKPLKKRATRHVKGGDTAIDGYKRVFKALKVYQRNLIYTENNRFFCVADMDENTRSYYAKDMTDEDYYDFWASFGFKAYQNNKDFFTCLVNKLRLTYERGGIKDAEAAAWSTGAYMTLSIASECHADAVKALAKIWEGDPKRLKLLFKPFDLSHVEKLWGDAHKDFFPELSKFEFSEFEFENIKVSFNQWAEKLVKGKTLIQSRVDTIADFSDDIFRTEGCAKKAMRELSDSELCNVS